MNIRIGSVMLTIDKIGLVFLLETFYVFDRTLEQVRSSFSRKSHFQGLRRYRVFQIRCPAALPGFKITILEVLIVP